MISVENNVIIMTISSTADKANIGYLKTRTSRVGSETFNCRQTNKTKAINPTIKQA
ncbi:hypothetical protein D3C76_77460 [compost metagenome]